MHAVGHMDWEARYGMLLFSLTIVQYYLHHKKIIQHCDGQTYFLPLVVVFFLSDLL
jgi:hypothetical protein